MELSQTAQVYAKVQLFDNRQPADRVMLQAWHEVLGHLDYADALEAVAVHMRGSTEYITPAHLVVAAKQSKVNRLAAENKTRAIAAAADVVSRNMPKPLSDEAFSAERLKRDYPHEYQTGVARGKSERAFWTTLRETGGDRREATRVKDETYAKVMADARPNPAPTGPPPTVDPGKDYTEPATPPAEPQNPVGGDENFVSDATIHCPKCQMWWKVSVADPDMTLGDATAHLTKYHPGTPHNTLILKEVTP